MKFVILSESGFITKFSQINKVKQKNNLKKRKG